MRPAKRLRTAFTVVIVLMCAALTSSAQAQGRGRVAICPIEFNHGTRTSHQTAIRFLADTLKNNGFTVVPYGECLSRWANMGLQEGNALAMKRSMVRFGSALNARYVVTAAIGFHSRSIWVDLGPRTCSTATINLKIASVPKDSIVYDRKNVKARNDEKFDPAKAAADVVFTPLVTAVSGGPKTPREQRAVQIAEVRALRGFLGAGAVGVGI